MFPESNESDLCARPVGNLVNHQAGGTLQYHQAGGTLGVLCGSYFFTTGVVDCPRVIFWVMLVPKVLRKSTYLISLDK